MLNLSRKHENLQTVLVGLGLEGFQNRAAVELQSSGIMELDAVLGGGFPRGSLVELCGPASSGRTSLAFSLLAPLQQETTFNKQNHQAPPNLPNPSPAKPTFKLALPSTTMTCFLA